MLVDERPIESHCCTPAAAHARTPADAVSQLENAVCRYRTRPVPLQQLILDFSFAARTRLLGWLQKNVPRGVAIACRVLVSLGGSCACQAQQHLKLYAVSGRCVCAFAREVRQRVLYAVSGRCVCTCAREVRQRVLYAVSGHCLCTYVRVPASCNIPVSDSNSFYLVTEHDRPALELRLRSAHDRIVRPKSRVGRKSLLWRSKAHRSPASSNLHTTMRWAHRSDEVPEIQSRKISELFYNRREHHGEYYGS